jgi:hypothetical protein
MSAVEQIVERLSRVRRNGNSHLASCPVASHGQGNGDRNPSLSVTEQNGRVLIACMAGCHTQDVLIALGLDWPDLFDEPITNERGALVASWTYQARDGSPYMISERWQTSRGKEFRPRIPTADRPGLPSGFKSALYKLPKVIAAAQAGEEIYVCEGEKAVHAAEHLGLVATTAPGGANKPWEPYYADWLRGASRVSVVADNDEPGMRHAAEVVAAMKLAGIPVRALQVAVPDAKADIFDHVRAGFGVADLKPLRVSRLHPAGVSLGSLMSGDYPAVKWVIPDLLPVGLTLLGGAPKVGKALSLDTPILTTDGWTTMGEIGVGQRVFSADGTPTTVVAATEVMHDRPCYRVTTHSGASLVADEQHQWAVRQRQVERVVTTGELARGHRGRRWLLPVAEALQTPDTELPLDPWLLGYWLGNGSAANSVLSHHPDDRDDVLARLSGYPIGSTRNDRINPLGVLVRLRALGVLHDKHIPDLYLRAGTRQRWDLLAGLLDADSHCVTRPNGSACIELTQIREELLEQAAFLARSLGFKTTVHKGVATLNGVEIGPKFRMVITASRATAPLTFSRRLAMLPDRVPAQRTRRDGVESVVPVDSVPVRCIQVAHPSGTYLAGSELTVTHNSMIALDIALAVAHGGYALYGPRCNQGSVLYLSLDNDDESTLAARARHLSARVGYPNDGPMEIRTEYPVSENAIAAISEWVELERDEDRRPLLVVADTLARIEPKYEGDGRGGQSLYGAATSTMARWSRLADQAAIGIVFIHHTRKENSEDWMHRFTGSQGLPAGCKNLMLVDHKRGSDEATLLTDSRHCDGQELKMVRDGWGWALFDLIKTRPNVPGKAGMRVIPGGRQ